MMKSNVVFPLPGEFQRADLYSRKRWRRVQYLDNQFWLCWRKEYLQSLQTRNKWSKDQRSLSVGNVVIVSEPYVPRNQWSLARVVETFQSDDRLVRSVKVQVGNRCLDRHGRRERGNLLTCETYSQADFISRGLTGEFPTEEPFRVNVYRPMICLFNVYKIEFSRQRSYLS